MEGHKLLDSAGGAGRQARTVVEIAFVLLLQCGSLASFAEAAHQVESADDTFSHGVSLARLGRWDDARAAFLIGLRRHPADARFPVELGAVAFKQTRYGEAVRWLRLGMRLNPSDSYVADFLGTIHFVQGNLEAALKYWNRLARPQIQNVRVEPGLRVDPVLLDRAFTIAPGSTLSLAGFLTTRARISGLEIFPAFDFRVEARDDGKFDATFAAHERNGFGRSRLEALLSAFRGVGYQTVHLEYFNIARSAMNITSLVRWDAQKRRVTSFLSGPLRLDPRRRYRAGMDFRDEDWDLRGSSEDTAQGHGTFRLRRSAVAAEVSTLQSGKWSWSAGGELSNRSYRDVSFGTAAPPEELFEGLQLKLLAQVNRELWRLPERRFESSVRISSEAATIWAAPAHSFQRLQASISARWFPTMTGDDYAVRHQVRAGRIFGQAPFDELFILGLERDNDLWMRAHIGTRDGRKGSAPLGQRYFLSNWEIDKNLYGNGLFSVKLSPFLDVGRMQSTSGLGPEKWLWDTGGQMKLRVLGVGFTLTYGKDLRSGKHTFYVMASR